MAYLLGHVGVPHANPTLYVFPADVPVPGESDRFAGKLVLFEERPEEYPDGSPGLGGFLRFSGTETLLERTAESPRHRVDAVALLTARLMDLLVGDRDRAIGNWRWGGVAEGNATVWYAIPRDRDQAFVQMDGVAKKFLSLWEPRLTRFDDSTPSIVGLTRNAWDLDRRYLSQVDRQQWDSVTAFLTASLTDDVLAAAVAQLPSDATERTRSDLLQGLKQRRDNLAGMSADFFALINDEADVWGTEAADSVHVSVESGSGTTIALFPRGTGEPAYWHRTFHPGSSSAVRVHLFEGDDVVVVVGAELPLHFVGGPGRDALINTGAAESVQFFDDGGRTTISPESSARWRQIDVPRPLAWGDSATGRDFGSAANPLGIARYSSDIGLVLGAGVERRNYGLFQRPYESRWRLTGGRAFGSERGLLRFDWTRLLGTIGPWVTFEAGYSGVERLRFYDFGNQTEANGPDSQYAVLHDRFGVRLALADSAIGNLTWSVGASARRTKSDTTGVATTLALVEPYGSGQHTQVGLEGSFRRCPQPASVGFFTRGRPLRCSDPGMGTLWTAQAHSGIYTPLGEPDFGTFATVEGRLAGQQRLSRRLAIASRVGFRVSTSETPFHQAAYIGGTATLRGFAFDRFVGSHAAFLSTEVRGWLGTVRTGWFPIEVGAIGLLDAGRVWSGSDDSGPWHVSWGGGLWIAPVKRAYLVHAVVAHSIEGTTVHIGPSFSF